MIIINTFLMARLKFNSKRPTPALNLFRIEKEWFSWLFLSICRQSNCRAGFESDKTNVSLCANTLKQGVKRSVVLKW